MIRAIWEFPDRLIGRQVIVYDQTDSTNNRALAHAPQQGLAFLADEQTDGRGTQGRRWNATPGASVLLSVLLHPPSHFRRAVLLTAWAAVSVQDTLASWGLAGRIKWPNDVLLRERKVAGILTEIHAEAVVVGIGLNVQQSPDDWAKLGLNTATSLRMEGVKIETEQVARELLMRLEMRYRQVLMTGVEELETSWRAGMELVGKTVAIDYNGQTFLGQLSELRFDLLSLSDGRSWRPEQVRLQEIPEGS